MLQVTQLTGFGATRVASVTAPKTLTAGSGSYALTGTAAGVTKTSGPPDASFSSTVLLLGFEGADASTTVTDQSSKLRGNATPLGNAQIDTAQFKFGSSSALFDGASDGFTFANHSDFDFGSGTFTVECWIMPATIAAGTRMIVGKWGNVAPNLGWTLFQNGSGLGWNVSTTGTNVLSDITGGTLTASTWAAICLDYDGSKYRLYKDGSMVGSFTTARTIFSPSKPLAIGENSDNLGLYFNGWIDELRITKGVARYASDSGYTVPTAAFPRS